MLQDLRLATALATTLSCFAVALAIQLVPGVALANQFIWLAKLRW